jgi:hypothetical protein
MRANAQGFPTIHPLLLADRKQQPEAMDGGRILSASHPYYLPVACAQPCVWCSPMRSSPCVVLQSAESLHKILDFSLRLVNSVLR